MRNRRWVPARFGLQLLTFRFAAHTAQLYARWRGRGASGWGSLTMSGFAAHRTLTDHFSSALLRDWKGGVRDAANPLIVREEPT